jgi:hypothetical protein
MWPFARKLVVDDETAAWHVDNFAWLIRQFGGAAGLARSKLVLPMPGYFVAEGEKGHAFALRIFDQIKALSCLKPHLAAMLRRALRDLADRPAITAPIVEAMQTETK